MSKKQKAGLDWKTTALHEHYTILYISLPSLHDVDVKCLISRFVEDMKPRGAGAYLFRTHVRRGA